MLLGLGLVALPVRPGADASFRPEPNDGCAQATECVLATNYICSTHNQDHRDYRCSKGCLEP